MNIESNSKIEVYFLYVKRDKKEWKNERVDLKNGFAEVYCYEEIRQVKNIGIETESGQVVKVV